MDVLFCIRSGLFFQAPTVVAPYLGPLYNIFRRAIDALFWTLDEAFRILDSPLHLVFNG